MKEQILFKLIELLKMKGFKHVVIDGIEWWKEPEKIKEAVEKGYYFSLIFDHFFAKYVWGEKISNPANIPDWMFHLSRLVVSNDRLAYLDIEILQKV